MVSCSILPSSTCFSSTEMFKLLSDITLMTDLLSKCRSGITNQSTEGIQKISVKKKKIQYVIKMKCRVQPRSPPCLLQALPGSQNTRGHDQILFLLSAQGRGRANLAVLLTQESFINVFLRAFFGEKALPFHKDDLKHLKNIC